MNLPEREPLDRQLLWLNIIGFGLVLLLLGSFTVLYGPKLLALVLDLQQGHPGMELLP